MADRLRDTGEELRGQNKQALVAKAMEELRVKLLDLSKRNRLLNFRHNRYCVKVVDEQPNQVTNAVGGIWLWMGGRRSDYPFDPSTMLRAGFAQDRFTIDN